MGETQLARPEVRKEYRSTPEEIDEQQQDSGAPEASTGAILSLPLWASLLLAAGSGAILDAGFPDRDWWILAPVGVALMLVSLIGRGSWTGLLVGLVAGFSFWAIHISWITLYLGPVPWLALAGLETIFFGVGLSLVAVVLRWGHTVWPTPLGRLGMVPVVVAGLWTAREAISAVWPYGGFAWGRVAMSQSESPFNSLVAWVGMSGLSFIMVWLSALVVQLFREGQVGPFTRWGIAVGSVALLLVFPAWPTIQTGTTRLAAVQGASGAGLFARYAPGQILADHTSATLPLIGEKVDFVVWPENSSDLDPTRSADAAKVADYISREMNAPLIAGTITLRDGKYYNSSLLWKGGRARSTCTTRCIPYRSPNICRTEHFGAPSRLTSSTWSPATTKSAHAATCSTSTGSSPDSPSASTLPTTS